MTEPAEYFEDCEHGDFPYSEGRNEELEDVIDFIRQQSVDALRLGSDDVSKFYDDLCARMQRGEHRK